MKEESLPILTHEHNLLVFWEDTKPNSLAAQKSGKVEFDTVLMMRVSVAGDKYATNEYDVQTTYPEGFPHPIHGKIRKNELLRERFGRYIDDYIQRQGGPAVISGTPIEQWAMVNRAQVANLKHNGIYSVESLATLSDQGMSSIGMDGRRLVQQAKDWLATAANSAAAMEAQERERRTEERFSALEEKYNELAGALEELPPDAQAQVRKALGRGGKKAA